MVAMDESLASPEVRTALVTGAASGIGRATVSRLLEQGWRIWAADLSPIDVEATWPGAGGAERIRTGRLDVSDEASVATLIAAVGEDSPGGLHGLVNSAGIVTVKQFVEHSAADWERCFRVNLLGTYLMIQHSVPLLRASGRGRIVNVSSMSAKAANPFTAPYAASKAGVISLTRSAAGALAPDIAVNCVCPGIIDTVMWEQLTHDFKEAGATLEFRSRAAQAPIGRAGSPTEVADAIIYLLGDAASFITGEDLNVTGGMIMH